MPLNPLALGNLAAENRSVHQCQSFVHCIACIHVRCSTCMLSHVCMRCIACMLSHVYVRGSACTLCCFGCACAASGDIFFPALFVTCSLLPILCCVVLVGGIQRLTTGCLCSAKLHSSCDSITTHTHTHTHTHTRCANVDRMTLL